MSARSVPPRSRPASIDSANDILPEPDPSAWRSVLWTAAYIACLATILGITWVATK